MKPAKQPAKALKILVFAHTPPPHHGQSVMVQALLDGLQSDPQFEVHHVNARLSDDMEDIGSMRPGKFLRLLKHIAQAWFIRLRHGAMTFYYIPGPVKKSATGRDLLVLALCRPAFPGLILHWHAWGIASWCLQDKGIMRKMMHKVLSGAETSIVLSVFQGEDVKALSPVRIDVVPNGIQDPCPDFKEGVSGLRREFFHRMQSSVSGEFRVLFLAHCMEAKGLFRTLDAVAALRNLLPACRVSLQVAGAFVSQGEKSCFSTRILRPDLLDDGGKPIVEHLGFCSGSKKFRLFRESHLLMFPTTYAGEVQPVNLVEAMAHGLPVAVTAWRGIPEMLPPGYPLADSVCTGQDLAALVHDAILTRDWSHELRSHYEQMFTLPRHVKLMKAALAF